MAGSARVPQAFAGHQVGLDAPCASAPGSSGDGAGPLPAHRGRDQLPPIFVVAGSGCIDSCFHDISKRSEDFVAADVMDADDMMSCFSVTDVFGNFDESCSHVISKRSEDLVATDVVEDDDMMSCFSDSDDFHSCADVDADENAFEFAAEDADTAESGPLTFRAPGGVAPRYAPADSRESAPRTAGETGGGLLGVVSVIRGRFGMSQAHAKLLTTAATGCPEPGASGPPDRVRGVFPLPYLVSERAAPRATLRAGARRRQVGRCRAVSKTNLVIGFLNLFFGGADCMAAGLSTRTGAAQLSALSRVQRAAQTWDSPRTWRLQRSSPVSRWWGTR